MKVTAGGVAALALVALGVWYLMKQHQKGVQTDNLIASLPGAGGNWQ